MRTLAVGIAVVSLWSIAVAGQGTAAPKTPASKNSAALSRTPWGDPDIQGVWSNTTTTPLERLPEAADKQVLTDAERAELAQKVAERLDADRSRRPGVVGAYNEFWFERGTLSNRTSLIIDPPEARFHPSLPRGRSDGTLSRRSAVRALPTHGWIGARTIDVLRAVCRGPCCLASTTTIITFCRRQGTWPLSWR